MRAERDELLNLSRSVGGVLLTVGAVVLLSRASSHSSSTDLARVLITLIPALLLFLLATAPSARDARGETTARGEPWRAVLLISSLLLGAVGLIELLHWLGADTNNPLYEALVLVVTAVNASSAGRRAQVPYALLLAAISLLLAWLLVWSKILNGPSVATERWLLVAAAVLLLGGAYGLARRQALGASDIATAGAIAAVSAGVIGVFVGLIVPAAHGLVSAGSPGPVARESLPLLGEIDGAQTFGWDLFLLLASLAFVIAGSKAKTRGLGYVGVAGLLGFILSVGIQVTRVESGHPRVTGIGGWPIVLLVIGAAALLAPALSSRSKIEPAASDGQR